MTDILLRASLFKQVKDAFEIIGKLRGEGHSFVGFRMCEVQFLRVKALTVYAILMQRLKARFRATVDLVTEEWMPKICHMHSYLVCSSRFKHALNVIKAV